MDSIIACKTIKKSGSSYAIYLTKEARLLHLAEGDTVEIVIKVKGRQSI